MKIANVDFPEPLLNALRDGRLVVFAGAGVSMGPPASLPDFRELARQVAEGTVLSIGEFETEDRFLGRLKDAGPNVHQRAAQLLQVNNPEPAELHINLLRLSAKAENVRIVTTNFDLLFEQAASNLFNPGPKIFHAPALPYGQRFQGIVHIHGAVSEPEETVLTSQDFGRAYLTEADGWARRFLVDLFARYTVLFVGYSHNDTIMTYLTPSLPRDSNDLRYALIGDRGDSPTHWHAMGIQPIIFPQVDKNDYSGLDNAVAGLAHYIRRGILDWQQEITNIASAPPPIDEESAGIIEYALSAPEMTRFFTKAAVDPDWIDWLDHRHRLDALFADGRLCNQDRMLASWLGRCFALAQDDALFRTIESHGSRLNPEFWKQLSWQMQDSIPKSPDTAAMTRWVLFLASVAPANSDGIALSWIAEASASVGAMDALLRAYEAMTVLINRELPRPGGLTSNSYHYKVEDMFTDCLRPNLPQIAEPVLEITARRLSERHSALTACSQGNSTWDPDSINRSAIEPHAQDQFQYDIHALIDVARECLEWLCTNRAEYARLWSERHANSQAPLLRRLAIHILPPRTDISASDKIAWLLEHCEVNETAAHHELFRAAGSAYPQASQELRAAFIKAVLDFRTPESEDYDSVRISAGHHFDWLHWLSESAPDCELAKKALDSILARYPEFLPSEHPDFSHWLEITWTGAQSPWTIEALLERPAAEILSTLLEYQPTDKDIFDGYHRRAMLDTITEAAKQNPDWGLDIADNLAASGEWNADLWHRIFRAWAETEMEGNPLHRALSHLSVDELQKEHVRDIANALCELAQKASSAEDESFLPKANAIAIALQQHAAKTEIPNTTRYVGGVLQPVGWLTTAINHPSGKLAEFWLLSIDAWRTHKKPEPKALSSEYQEALSEMMTNLELPGTLARVVLTSSFRFLAYVDESWTRQNLLPLLEPEHRDFDSAWDGLTYGAISPRTAELLREPFLNAVEHISQKATSDLQHRFIRMYTGMLTWFATGPTDHWITKLLSNSDEEIRHSFAREIGFILSSLDEEAQREWWSVWLKGYWQNRLQNVPVPLDDREIEAMTEWTSGLSAIYPEAVELAVQMPAVQLQRSSTLFELKNSDMPDKHPESVAKLLIYLSKENSSTFILHGAKKIIDRLLQSGLNEETETGLKEVAAKAGL